MKDSAIIAIAAVLATGGILALNAMSGSATVAEDQANNNIKPMGAVESKAAVAAAVETVTTPETTAEATTDAATDASSAVADVATAVSAAVNATEADIKAVAANVADDAKAAVTELAANTENMVAAVATAATTTPAADGKATYDMVCMACHTTGAANAPRLGDKAAWEPRLAKGIELLTDHALHGFNNVMPAKGGRADLSDETVIAAMHYMLDQVK